MAAAKDRLGEQLHVEGFAVVRHALEPERLRALRSTLLSHFRRNGIRRFGGKSQPNAAVEIPTLAPLFHHPSIVAICRRAVADGVPVFTSHCDVHLNTTSGWHDDTGGRAGGGYFGDAPLHAPRVYKLGIYLQDHGSDGSGLSVRPGSHLDAAARQTVDLTTRLGDVAIFDVRTQHAGREASLASRAVWRGCAPFGQTGHSIYSLLRQSRPGPMRLAVFFTIGRDDAHTITFAARNMDRALELTGGSRWRLDESLRKRLTDAGVKLAEDRFAPPGRM